LNVGGAYAKRIYNSGLGVKNIEGMGFAYQGARGAIASFTGRSEIMFSAWWVVGAFVMGGYAGMLLIALVVIARRTRAPGSVFK